MSLVILPGSYDPMTLGHLDLVRRALERYDEAVVAVMVNPDKHTMFDMQTRVRIAECTVAGLRGVSVISDTGMLVDLYERLHADAVCKGWRNETDYRYECEMAEWNRVHGRNFQTLLLHAEGQHATVSSTQVREMLMRGESPSQYLHPEAIRIVLSYLNQTPSGKGESDRE